MDHFTLNLRPNEYFQPAPNMKTAYIILRIYVMSKSVTYLEASATAADPSSFNVIRRLIGKGQVTPAKHTWG